MLYYEYRGYTLCSCEELPYRHLAALPQEGEVLYLFERPLMIGRDTFPVTDAALLTAEEGVQTLCAGEKAGRARRSWQTPSRRGACAP